MHYLCTAIVDTHYHLDLSHFAGGGMQEVRMKKPSAKKKVKRPGTSSHQSGKKGSQVERSTRFRTEEPPSATQKGPDSFLRKSPLDAMPSQFAEIFRCDDDDNPMHFSIEDVLRHP
jgi:hypothetical protein